MPFPPQIILRLDNFDFSRFSRSDAMITDPLARSGTTYRFGENK